MTPVSLREVYASVGSYSAKFLIDPKVSLSVTGVTLSSRNSDGREFPVEIKRWGTKLTIEFTIDQGVPDGVIVLDFVLNSQGKVLRERFDFWVIK